MTKTEIITAYYDRIAEALPEKYRAVLESGGHMQCDVYIWEDGELEFLCEAQGSTSYLKPKDCEPRMLYFVWRISAPCFDPWDAADHSAPDDEAQREAEREEIIDFLADEYKANVGDVMDAILQEAKQEDLYNACNP